MASLRFTKDDRLRKRADFDRVYRQDAYAADAVLVVKACRNDLAHTRLGVSVSRKVGPAVVRNRWKRLLREAFRTQRDKLPAGLDLVFRPRRGAQPDFHAIARSVPQLARRVAAKVKGGKG